MLPRLNEYFLAEKLLTAKPGDYAYTLFLGAGASASSGILTAGGMIAQWQRKLYQSMADSHGAPLKATFDEWLKAGYLEWLKKQNSDRDHQYSTLFEWFYQSQKERQLFIEQQIENKKPGWGYLYLAGLIADDRFNRILTTNFDDLLSDALVRFYGVRPQACAFDSAVAGLRVASKRPKIVKLHGDYLYDNVRNVRHELHQLDVNMEEKMRELCKDSGLIVVGYSGHDESIMAPIRDMLRKKNYLNMGLHWCLQKAPPGQAPYMTRNLQDLKNNYGDRVHLYEIEGFDQLMEKMFVACGCQHPKALIAPQRHGLYHEFYAAVANTTWSASMRKHLQEYTNHARDAMDARQHDYITSDIYSDACREDGARKDFHSARANLARCNELIEQFCNASTDDPSSRWLIERKRGAARLLAAELNHDERGSSAETNRLIEESLVHLENGILMCRTEHEDLPPPVDQARFYYNACCALGLKFLTNGEASREDLVKLQAYLGDLRRLDLDGSELRDLLTGDDFEPFRHLLSLAGVLEGPAAVLPWGGPHAAKHLNALSRLASPRFYAESRKGGAGEREIQQDAIVALNRFLAIASTIKNGPGPGTHSIVIPPGAEPTMLEARRKVEQWNIETDPGETLSKSMQSCLNAMGVMDPAGGWATFLGWQTADSSLPG